MASTATFSNARTLYLASAKVEAKRAKKSLEHDAPLAGDKMPYKLKASLLSPNLRQRFAHLL